MSPGLVRVVLDTNVLVSALLVPGSPPAKILELVLAGNLRLVISPGIITELASVVTYPKLKKSLLKYGVSDEDVAHALHTLLKIATITPGADIARGVSVDPKDDMVLSCALEGQADVIISGDQDLRKLTSHEGVRIVTPANFLQIITERVSTPA